MGQAKTNIEEEDSAKDKKKTIEATISAIEKQFGKGSIMRLEEGSTVKNVSSIPTGSIGLDSALGVGGFPRGRIIEVYGPEASGKTTLALHAIAETQKNGGITAFVDAEHAFDPTYARGLGINKMNTFFKIKLPIAIRQSLPAYGNEMILMLKGTSLASTVTLLDLTGVAKHIISTTFRPIEVFIVAGSIYLLMTFIIHNIIKLLEKRYEYK